MHNDDVSGVVEIIGSVNTENFGSYTYEYSTVGEPNWQTIAAGSGNRIDESLGNWYTSDLTPGPYFCVWWLWITTEGNNPLALSLFRLSRIRRRQHGKLRV